MKFKYVNPKLVEEVIGRYAPINSFMFARIIEETLENTNLGYVHTEAGKGRFQSDPPEISEALEGIADKLLAHNLSRNKQHNWDFFSGLDFDLVHESNHGAMKNGASVNTTVKAYFYHTEFSREKNERRVVFHLQYNAVNGTQWAISFPVQAVMKGFPKIPDSYVGYSHGISLLDEDGKPKNPQHNYIGITKRGWLKRMSEHFREVENGSNKTFHSAWREYSGRSDVLLTSELIVLNHSFEEIMSWEEWAVDREMNAGTSLNMIPGGFKGMKFLYEHSLTSSERVSIEEREAAIANYQAANQRLSVPNLLISELWNNQDYAEKVICGAEGRLSPEQVREIRSLNSIGLPIEKIRETVGAKNLLQVQRVLDGITYSRIH